MQRDSFLTREEQSCKILHQSLILPMMPQSRLQNFLQYLNHRKSLKEKKSSIWNIILYTDYIQAVTNKTIRSFYREEGKIRMFGRQIESFLWKLIGFHFCICTLCVFYVSQRKQNKIHSSFVYSSFLFICYPQNIKF